MDSLPQRKTHRLQNYDYASAGFYYVTICTHEKQERFGVCDKGIMTLITVGQIAEKFWKEIPSHYPGTSLDVFVFMPNHLHGIIIINQRPAGGWPYSLSKIVGSYKNITS